MKNAVKMGDVVLGGLYVAKVSGKLTVVEIHTPVYRNSEDKRFAYWQATNLATGKKIRIKSAAKLRLDLGKFGLQRQGHNIPTQQDIPFGAYPSCPLPPQGMAM